jgi:hypothetical protein
VAARGQVRQVAGAAVNVRRRFSAAVALLGAVLAVAGCGAAQYRYVGSVPDRVYFQVPSAWQQLSPGDLSVFRNTVLAQNAAGPQGGQLDWSAGFDASAHPTVAHLFGFTGQPVVYSSVQVMNPVLRNALSYDFMRDLLIPVTADRRQQLEAAGQKLQPLHLLAPPVTYNLPGGIRGIGELFEIKLRSGTEVYAQTVLTDSATSKLYLLFVQCDQTCFNANISQIGSVVRSFTVKGP